VYQRRESSLVSTTMCFVRESLRELARLRLGRLALHRPPRESPAQLEVSHIEVKQRKCGDDEHGRAVGRVRVRT